jgi:hypothetical protein
MLARIPSQCITNYVSMDFMANVLLSAGACAVLCTPGPELLAVNLLWLQMCIVFKKRC